MVIRERLDVCLKCHVSSAVDHKETQERTSRSMGRRCADECARLMTVSLTISRNCYSSFRYIGRRNVVDENNVTEKCAKRFSVLVPSRWLDGYVINR
jgi:ribosomal protein L31